MIQDADNYPNEAVLENDLCIVGAGPAGLALAKRLTHHGREVLLLESGGLSPTIPAQLIARARNGGLRYFPLDANRCRTFGGSTQLWTGWCKPFREIDLAKRSWVPHSGWPIALEEIEPHYPDAFSFLGLTDSGFDLREMEAGPEQTTLAFSQDCVRTELYRITRPDIVASRAAKQMASHTGIKLVTGCTVIAIQTNAEGSRVTGLEARARNGRHLSIRAREYVLALGGVENARLLLASNSVRPEGVGNWSDQVGRYFMEHLVFPSGRVTLHPGCPEIPGHYFGLGGVLRARLSAPPRVQEQEGTLQFCTQLEPTGPQGLKARLRRTFADRSILHGNGVIGQRLIAYGIRRRKYDPRQNAWQGSVTGQRPRTLRLLHVTEQAPNPSSRMVLDRNHRDRFGLPLARLEWQTAPIDERTAHVAGRFIGGAFEAAGMGRFEGTRPGKRRHWPPLPLQGFRGHHMGTTRMSLSPADGVVDANCKVHEIGNLHIAGSSVFPTGGCGVPTGTIVALAFRLADHLCR